MKPEAFALCRNVVLVVMCIELLTALAWANASELSFASARGDTLTVQSMLEEGAIPDEIDKEGYTPLLRTVFAGVSRPLSMHFDVMKLLIDAGADVNASVDVLSPEDDNPIRTVSALHRTVLGGAAFLELTFLLLENGADPNLAGAWGRPLHIAAASDKAGPDEVKLLLDWGADVKAVNQWGIEPLVEAVTASKPSFEKVELLLEAGSDVNVLFDWNDHYGLSVLMAAAMNGTSDIVKLLLNNGALKHSKSSDGFSAYDYAVKAERMDNAFMLR